MYVRAPGKANSNGSRVPSDLDPWLEPLHTACSPTPVASCTSRAQAKSCIMASLGLAALVTQTSSCLQGLRGSQSLPLGESHGQWMLLDFFGRARVSRMDGLEASQFPYPP